MAIERWSLCCAILVLVSLGWFGTTYLLGIVFIICVDAVITSIEELREELKKKKVEL